MNAYSELSTNELRAVQIRLRSIIYGKYSLDEKLKARNKYNELYPLVRNFDSEITQINTRL